MKNKNFLATKSAALASLAIFVASCGATSNAAAEINGRKISRSELEQTVTELGEAGQTPVIDGEIDGETVRGILSALVQGAATDQVLKIYGEEILPLIVTKSKPRSHKTRIRPSSQRISKI